MLRPDSTALSLEVFGGSIVECRNIKGIPVNFSRNFLVVVGAVRHDLTCRLVVNVYF